MTQEQKELLLKDLCSRLPYGVKVKFKVNDVKAIEEKFVYVVDGEYSYITDGKSCLTLDIIKLLSNNYLDDIKPYLFPLESMTEEQKKYINDRWGVNENFNFKIDPNWGDYFVELRDAVDFIKWCYENHLDVNGLIPKDLANDATNLKIY
jgi:hypothetical protein